MSLYTRVCVALFGICGGIVVLFAADMLLNSGRFVAHTVHSRTPDCSGSCHGSTDQQNAARSAPGGYCRLCKQPIDPHLLRLDPGAVLCWECKWRKEECTDGRR